MRHCIVRTLALLMAMLLLFAACAAEVAVGPMGTDDAPVGAVFGAAEDDLTLEPVITGVDPQPPETEMTLGDEAPEGGEPARSDAQQPELQPEEVEPSRPEDAPETGAESEPEEGQEPGPENAPEDGQEPQPEGAPEDGQEPQPEGTPEDGQEPQPEDAQETGETPEPQDAPEVIEEPQALTEVGELALAPAEAQEVELPEMAETAEEASEAPAAEAAGASPVSIKIGLKEKYSLPRTAGPGTPSFASADAGIASVSADGIVRGVKRGSTTVVANYEGTAVEYAIEVVKAPKWLTLSKKKLTLGYDAARRVGEQFRLTPKLSAGSGSKITYTGYRRSVVSVSEDGVVTAVGIGSTKIVARTYNKKKATVKVVVRRAPGRLNLKKRALTLIAGSGFKLKCTRPKRTAGAIHWRSENPGVVTVNEKGRVTAVSAGVANVVAECFNGVSVACAVTVVPSIEPAFTSIYLGKGESSGPILGAEDPKTLFGGVTFSSSKRSVARVTAQGVIKGKKPGTAVIRVRAANGSKRNVRVRVYKAPTKVMLNAKKLTVEQYTGIQLEARFPAKQWGSVEFTSSKPSVAEVDPTGFVSAIGKGTTVITARTYNGKKATCTITVTGPDVEIHIPESMRITTTGYTDFPIEILTSSGGAYIGPIEVTIEPSRVAVYENGRLLGKRSGETGLLTVKAAGEKATCVVTVDGVYDGKPVMAIAHRGGARWPENSLEAFRNFPATGAEGVELDVRSTRDGCQVVFHDATVPINGVAMPVAEMDLEAFKALNPNYCTLDEALDVIKATGKDIFLNPKDTADGAKCVEAVRKWELQSRTVYFCNSESLLRAIYNADNGAQLGYSMSSGSAAMNDSLADLAKNLHLSYVMPHKSLINQEVVNFWRDRGYKVCAWTVNDRSTIKSLCDMGVDAILSDYPGFVVEERANS